MKRRGFTLIELLIVVVVIGVLSSMMMMSSSEAVTTSKASNIVSNLRSLSSAAMALYIDSFDTWETTTQTPTSKDIMNYINNAKQTPELNKYNIELAGENNHKASARSWYITYSFKDEGSDKDRIKAKVAGRAKSAGLIGVGNNIQDIDDKKIYTNEEKIALKVR